MKIHPSEQTLTFTEQKIQLLENSPFNILRVDINPIYSPCAKKKLAKFQSTPQQSQRV
jgi:hypothetical protein